jgi:hypothetical protein
MMASQVEIMEATSSEDYAAGKILIEEYAAALGVDLCFQNFSEEIASLPKIYGPPPLGFMKFSENCDLIWIRRSR